MDQDRLSELLFYRSKLGKVFEGIPQTILKTEKLLHKQAAIQRTADRDRS